MKTIVIAAEKGGVGKTTLAASLAVIAALTGAGARVGILDLDPQGSLTNWWNRRPTGWPVLCAQCGSPAQSLAAIQAKNLDFLVIDTPPGYSPIRAEAIALADLVLIPTGPGALDLAGIAPVMRTAAWANVPCRTVLNRAAFRTRVTGAAVKALREQGGFLEPVVHARQPILAAMETGRTVLETAPDTPGAAEMIGLWHSIAALLASMPARQIVIGRPARAKGRLAA
jgi:chromosome partitioning protein